MDGSVYKPFFDGIDGVFKALGVMVVVSILLALVLVGVVIRGCTDGGSADESAKALVEDRGLTVTEVHCQPWSGGTTACTVIDRAGTAFAFICTKRTRSRGYRCVDGITPLTAPLP